jgi:hypothetical protein
VLLSRLIVVFDLNKARAVRGREMNMNIGQAKIDQWLAHVDKGELLQVVRHDDQSHTIELQSFDGYVDEIDDETWNALPLERSAPPEDWTAPMDDVETHDLATRKPR